MTASTPPGSPNITRAISTYTSFSDSPSVPSTPAKKLYPDAPRHSVFVKHEKVRTVNSNFLNVFIISIVALGMIAIIVGVLAALASGNALPDNLHTLNHLSAIGTVNSYFMITGGAVLIILGFLTLFCQRKKQAPQPFPQI